MSLQRQALLYVSVVASALALISAVCVLHVWAQGPNEVGLVVHMGDGILITRCVEFGEAQISGYDVLVRSDLKVVASQASGTGIAICRIGDTGCQPPNCFCKCSGSTCSYWSYWHLVDGQWSYSGVGSDAYRVRPGDVEGWSWSNGQPPPVISFEEVCVPAPTAMSLPTSTPVPPMATPQPTHTVTPLSTATPTLLRDPSIRTPLSSPTAMSMNSATVPSPIGVSSPTFTPFPTIDAPPAATATLAIQPVQEPSPSPETDPQALAPGQVGAGGLSRYVLFGVLLAVLLALFAVILVRRKG